jgi:outer membrane protein OmpA-like peptidoglycan-associated protein
MFGLRSSNRQNPRDEAEKPFWISFADLMTALMILFLVVMVIALVNVTRQTETLKQQEAELAAKEAELDMQSNELDGLKIQNRDNERRKAEQGVFKETLSAGLPPGVELDGDILRWGEKMRFEQGESSLTAEKQAQLRSDIKPLLKQATGTLGSKTLKRFVLEGFASPEGDYLSNLNLSLDRSQRVVCALLDQKPSVGTPLTPKEQEQVVNLFLISGYSSNAAIKTKQQGAIDPKASRRVELRLEWKSNKADDEFHPVMSKDELIGNCALGS